MQFSDTHDDEEDPDCVQGLEPATVEDLGLPRTRDPDALPPRNRAEWVMGHVYRFVMSFGGGNVLYAFKAGLLTGLWAGSLRFLVLTAHSYHVHSFLPEILRRLCLQ